MLYRHYLQVVLRAVAHVCCHELPGRLMGAPELCKVTRLDREGARGREVGCQLAAPARAPARVTADLHVTAHGAVELHAHRIRCWVSWG